MRKYGLCVIFLLLVLILVGCNKGESDNMYHQQSEAEFTMNYADKSISSSGITLAFLNKSSCCSYQYDDVYALEKNIDGEWCDVPPVNNISSLATAYIVLPGETVEHDVIWEPKYGSLSTGKYRISKRIEKLLFDEEDEIEKITDEIRVYLCFSL